MYWFARPPWIRWVLSAMLVTAAFGIELTGPATEARWFAKTDISAGEQLAPSLFEFKDVSAGSLADVRPTGFARVAIDEGDPLTASLMSTDPLATPAGWWNIEMAVPQHLTVGQPVLLVILNADTEPTVVDGIVVSVSTTNDPFSQQATMGIIAVPPEDAAIVAAANQSGRMSVLTSDQSRAAH